MIAVWITVFKILSTKIVFYKKCESPALHGAFRC